MESLQNMTFNLPISRVPLVTSDPPVNTALMVMTEKWATPENPASLDVMESL